MHVFVTGAAGYVGSAIARELLDNGYEVSGLARSDAEAKALADAGILARRGAIDDLVSLHDAAVRADAVIHEAPLQVGPRVGFPAACLIECQAVRALGDALVGSDRPFVVTSGVGLIAPGEDGLVLEDGPYDLTSPAAPRIPMERAALAFADRGVRASVVRFAWCVHSAGAREGFLPALIDVARRTGVSAYIADGSNRWSAVHRDDLAKLYVRALESASAGARLHAVDDEGVALAEIAAAIGRQLDVPITSVSTAQASEHFGWLSHFAAYDAAASSAETQKASGWQPAQEGLIGALADGRYFAT